MTGTELVAAGEPCESGSHALDAVPGDEGSDERSARECSTALRRRGSFFSSHAYIDSAMVLNSGSTAAPHRKSACQHEDPRALIQFLFAARLGQIFRAKKKGGSAWHHESAKQAADIYRVSARYTQAARGRSRRCRRLFHSSGDERSGRGRNQPSVCSLRHPEDVDVWVVGRKGLLRIGSAAVQILGDLHRRTGRGFPASPSRAPHRGGPAST